MKRGYVSGRNRIAKQEKLFSMGVPNDGYCIREDGIPPKVRSADNADDFPQRKLAVGDLRPGDVLCVADLMDLGKMPDEVVKVVADICARGAAVEVYGDPAPIRYNSPEDAALTADLLERTRTQYRKRQGTKMAEARKASGKKTGPKGRFANDLKAHRKALYAIWADEAVSRAEAIEQMNKLLHDKRLKPISAATIQREFGNKTDAEKASQ